MGTNVGYHSSILRSVMSSPITFACIKMYRKQEISLRVDTIKKITLMFKSVSIISSKMTTILVIFIIYLFHLV